MKRQRKELISKDKVFKDILATNTQNFFFLPFVNWVITIQILSNMKTFIDKMDYAVKNWWLSLLVGLLYIIVAIYLMFAPLASYVALSILFSVSMFVSGLFEIAFALANKKGYQQLGMVFGRRYYRLDLRYILDGKPGT